MAFAPKFKITYDDQTVQEIASKPIDLVRWERKTGRSFATDEPTIDQLLWAAWSAGVRQKLITDDAAKKFDTWLEKVDDLDRLEDEPEKAADPTPADGPPEVSLS